MIRLASLGELRARGEALFAAAAEETGVSGEPFWEAVETADEAGLLVLLVVEVGGELVGYCAAGVVPELFRAAHCCATWSLYVHPAHRGRWGRALLRALADEARDRGVATVRFSAIPGSRLHRLLARLGLRPTAIAYDLDLPQDLAGV